MQGLRVKKVYTQASVQVYNLYDGKNNFDYNLEFYVIVVNVDAAKRIYTQLTPATFVTLCYVGPRMSLNISSFLKFMIVCTVVA